MFDYIKFRTAAYKHKYDTAIETASRRITYGELNSFINALHNSVTNMNLSGRAMVMLGDTPELAVSCLALSKAGFDVMSVSPLVSSKELEKAYTDFEPSVVFADGAVIKRLCSVLLKLGCTTAVVVGNAQNVFPAQFDYNELINANDYRLVNRSETGGGRVSFFYGSKKELPELPEVSSAIIHLPLCEKQGASLMSQMLYSGGRCILLSDINKKTVKKKKAEALFTDVGSAYLYTDLGCEVYTFEFADGCRRCGDRLVDAALLSKYFTDACGAPVTVEFSGVRMRITLTLGKDADKENIADHPAVKAVKAAASDLLYAIDVPKTFSVKKTV